MPTSNIRQQHGQRNEACEPKQHRQSFSSQNAELMCRDWEAVWCEDEVYDCEDCPDAAEEEEVGLGGGPVPGPVVDN